MESICDMGYHRDWNVEIVKAREDVMLDAIWTNLQKWLM